jgi:Fe-S cluster assembly protein SufB
MDLAPKGLNEDVVRLISSKKDEPAWPNVHHPPIDYQDMHYWAAPKPKGPAPKSLDEVDPQIRAEFDSRVGRGGARRNAWRCEGLVRRSSRAA